MAQFQICLKHHRANVCNNDALYQIKIENANLKKEQSNLQEEVNIMNFKAKITKITEKRKNTDSDDVKDINFECDICSFNAGTKNTLGKPNNTKHQDLKGDMIVLKDSIEGDPECSMWQNKLPTSTELNYHIEEYLKGIEDIDVEYLKSGHKEF